jgi:predicted N-acetyltransferase YhbS
MWKAWWEPYGNPLIAVENHLRQDIASAAKFPFGIVAHENENYFGHCLAIPNDLDERPDLSPWIAALWVEPEFRRQGIAAKLMDRAIQELQALGNKSVYLCAVPAMRNYYLQRGWILIDQDQGGSKLDVFSADLIKT